MRCVGGILLLSLFWCGSALAQQTPSDQSSGNQPAANQPASSQPSSNPSSPNQSPNQPSSNQASPQAVPPNQAPPRSKEDEKSEQEKSRDRSAEAGESSSLDTRIDTSPPKDDAKNHPNSGAEPPGSSGDASDVQEMHPWNPYRALKDDEVGEFYFKQKDYKGALARFQDALIYKPNDAVANFRMAQVYEKMGQPEDAIPHYQEYLKILPQGPFSKDARRALAKLGASENQTSEKMPPK